MIISKTLLETVSWSMLWVIDVSRGDVQNPAELAQVRTTALRCIHPSSRHEQDKTRWSGVLMLSTGTTEEVTMDRTARVDAETWNA